MHITEKEIMELSKPYIDNIISGDKIEINILNDGENFTMIAKSFETEATQAVTVKGTMQDGILNMTVEKDIEGGK